MKIKLLMAVLCLGLANMLFAQNISVKGTVKDAANNEPLVGAYVQVKGTNTGTMTASEGVFTLKCPQNAVLVFSYVGYTGTEVPVNNRSVVDVSLQSSNVLDEVVITAMGMTRSQKSVGYATSTVKADHLTMAKSTSLMSCILGKGAALRATIQGCTAFSQ